MDRLSEFAQANLPLVLIFVGLTVAIVVTEVRALFRRWKSLTPAQLTDLINREDALVIDVRSQAEYEKGHIIGARHVLPSQVEPAHKLLANATDKPVVIVCAAGMNASAIAARLVKAGFRNAGVLDGGVGAWQAAGLPLVRGKA